MPAYDAELFYIVLKDWISHPNPTQVNHTVVATELWEKKDDISAFLWLFDAVLKQVVLSVAFKNLTLHT